MIQFPYEGLWFVVAMLRAVWTYSIVHWLECRGRAMELIICASISLCPPLLVDFPCRVLWYSTEFQLSGFHTKTPHTKEEWEPSGWRDWHATLLLLKGKLISVQSRKLKHNKRRLATWVWIWSLYICVHLEYRFWLTITALSAVWEP